MQNMDINYLLFLQDLRYATSDVFTSFMQWVSSFSVSYIILLPALIYWCWDKKRGLQIFASLCLCVAIGAFIKLTACVYRPWMRDPRIIPASFPNSYSFPSGHTAMGTPMYLGSAIVLWQKKQTKILAILCVLFALLNPFSRNYLGVHTPQDVCVGFLLSLGCLYVAWRAGDYFRQYPEKENLYLLVVSLISILAFLYTLYKPYPLDYIGGKLLANPQRMVKSAYEGVGFVLGFCGARYVEKTWIRFQTTGWNMKGFVCGVIGAVPLCMFYTILKDFLHSSLGANWGRFTWSVCLIFYIIALYPLVMKWLLTKKIHS